MDHSFHPSPIIPLVGMLIPITVLLVFGILGIVRIKARQAERMKLYSVIQALAEAGQTLPPELGLTLAKDDPVGRAEASRSPLRDLRRGLLFIALGLGLLAYGAVSYLQYGGPNPHMLHGPAAMAPIPLFIGLAYLLLYAFGRRRI
jgi:hypothetical protein